MADRRIYAGYYRRYDSKLIYVVTVAKDADTSEEMVVWTPATYSEKHTYYTTSKQSFCESVLVGGVRRPKFKRQTQMRVLDSVVESFEAEGFFRSPRKADDHINDEYDIWCRPCADSYYEYAKKLCEGYRFSLSKYELCVREKRYIGISKEDFRELKSDLAFLKSCLRACLKSSNEDGNEGKRENLSRNIKFAFTIFPKSAEFVEPAEKTLYHPAAWQNDKLV